MYLRYCALHLSLMFRLNTFFSLVLFPSGIHSGREKKLTNNYMYIKRFLKDVIYLFCCQFYLKHVLENYRFCQKSENGAYSRGWGVMLFASLWCIAYKNRYVTHHLPAFLSNIKPDQLQIPVLKQSHDLSKISF